MVAFFARPGQYRGRRPSWTVLGLAVSVIGGRRSRDGDDGRLRRGAARSRAGQSEFGRIGECTRRKRPLVAKAPCQPPEAVQEVAFCDCQRQAGSIAAWQPSTVMPPE